MNPARNKKETSLPTIVRGEFTKKEAAQKIAEGVGHFFSFKNSFGLKLLELTERALAKGKIPRFPWELLFFRRRLSLLSSKSRTELIKKIVADLKLEKKRMLRERVEGILEELLTNAIYHSQTLPGGEEKYNRQLAVELQENEKIVVTYGQRNTGIFISVTDHGGTLSLSEIGKAFSRCYGSHEKQIESKTGGAGLGLYLIFEEVTHLKVVTQKNKSTTISCWISNENQEFSFNFFEEEK